ncbi:MAG: hypothetical protein B7X11_03695 [Acidobacteria bacterium 37-65-4]|nr:MAG: hypothetical protein B7X11_03695 [Acidobacteria bacterium 37-65-4]
MSIEFQWDKEKAIQNLKKHGVTFEEATTAFYDTLSITISDNDHSEGEARFLLLGLSNQSRLLVVSHSKYPPAKPGALICEPLKAA